MMLLTRLIHPLSLREKISWFLRSFVSKANEKDVSLSHNNSVRLDLSYRDIGHQSIILNGFYELDLTKKIKKLAKTGGLLVDVGANYGYFSCLWAGENVGNKVIAFEASPVNITAIQNNITKNNFDNQIKLESIAVGREVGTLSFTLANMEGQTGWGGLLLESSSTSIEVSVDTLENYAKANKIEEIDVLKVDVEGADTWVILGANTLIEQKKIKHIFFEVNKARMSMLNIVLNEAEDFLTKNGYLVEKMSESEYYAYVS